MMDDLSAKVFRTYNASITLQEQLALKKEDKKDTVDSKVKFYNDANREVAILCNHQKAVSKSHEQAMEKLGESLKTKKEQLQELESALKVLNKGGTLKNKDKSFPKNVDACKKAIEKKKKAIQSEEFKCREKEDNKNIALGTSKINYMDPRITVSWCKNHEVPIERVFPKTLRSKFAWAMNVDPSWEF